MTVRIGQRHRGELLRRFAAHALRPLHALYPVFLAGAESALVFLADIDTYVYCEFLKLYPIPSCHFRVPDGSMTAARMVYRSSAEWPISPKMIEAASPTSATRLPAPRDVGGRDGKVVRFELVATPRQSPDW